MADAPMIRSNSQLVDIICDFLECAIHMILYMREVYPAELFERKRRYNVPVQRSRHPALNDYIHTIVEAARPLFYKGTLERFCVVICTEEQRMPLENFVFSFKNARFGDTAAGFEAIPQGAVEALLRSFLLKISVSDAILNVNPPDITFYALVYLAKELDVADQGRMQGDANLELPWVIADTNEQQQVAFQDALLIPLKSIDNSIFKLQLYVQERNKDNQS